MVSHSPFEVVNRVNTTFQKPIMRKHQAQEKESNRFEIGPQQEGTAGKDGKYRFREYPFSLFQDAFSRMIILYQSGIIPGRL